MANFYNNITELIGKTPLLRLLGYENKIGTNSKIYAKLEYFNPSGSVKDRIALSMIETAEKNGMLKKDSTIIEPTSGNTGIGIAAISSSKGYNCIIVMPESMSIERRKLIKKYGADIVLTPASEGMTGANKKAYELLQKDNTYFMPSQFENPSNPNAHYYTTAPEIYNDLDGNIDCFISGIGTGGTISGVGKFLKEKNPSIKVIGIEPINSSVLSGNNAGPHRIQGIGAGFIPKTLDTTIYDEILKVDDNTPFLEADIVSKTDGVCVGISSGAALSAVKQVCQNNNYSNIVVIFPDSADKYFSTPLFD